MEYIFTQADFITDTTPMYSDPEGDTPYKIRIEMLPTVGTLEYDGVPVVEGQVLDYTTQVGDGTFKYITDPSRTDSYQAYFYFRASDVGSELWSNIGTITFNIVEEFNAPTVDDNSGILSSKIFTFGEGSFTNGFADLDGDGYNEVIIESLPIVPQLKLLGTNTAIGDRFLAVNSSGLKFHLLDNYAIYNGILYKFNEPIDTIISDFNSLGYQLTENLTGKLTFTNQEDATDIVFIQGTTVPNTSLQFTFRITDDSTLNAQSNLATFSLIPQGDVNVKPINTNAPPIVGDNEVKTFYTKPYIFDRNDFIEDTDPRFFDEDGDQPHELRIDSLPPNGILYYNSVAVNINDIFPFVGGIDEEKLMYIPDSNRTDIEYVIFDFSVSDTGTKTFAS